jgi:hypothetical protein
MSVDNPHNGSHLQTMPPKQARFWPKIEGLLQKNGGPTETILHFLSRFPDLLGLFPLQSVASQGQAAIKTLPKKSCLKTYRRFFVRSGLCHNRRMNGRIVRWEMGREKPAAGLRGDVARPSSAASSSPERFRGVHRPKGGGPPPQLACEDAYATASWPRRNQLARGAPKVRFAHPWLRRLARKRRLERPTIHPAANCNSAQSNSG